MLKWFIYMLKTRLITGTIFAAIVVYILSFSPIHLFESLFATVVSISIFLAGSEFIAMRWAIMDGPKDVEQRLPHKAPPHFFIGASYGILVFLFYICSLIYKQTPEKGILICVGWVFFCLFLSAGIIYKTANDMHSASNKILNIMAGYIYLSLPACFLLRMGSLPHQSPYRAALIYFCLSVTFMGDVWAYLVGMRFGKHKLIPKVSPKKSVEGSIAGLVASGLTGIVLGYFLQLPYPLWLCLIVGISCGIAGQIGDLMESAFKRASGFKDSGRLLPGHGGVLDRIDSLMLSMPVAYIFFALYL